LGQTSRNSGKPSNSDGLAKLAPKLRRKRGQRKPGGQDGLCWLAFGCNSKGVKKIRTTRGEKFMDEFGNIIYDNVKFGQEVGLGHHNILGIYHERLAVKYALSPIRKSGLRGSVVIGDRTTLCNHVTIYEDVVIGTDCYIDDYVRVGTGTRVGEGSLLLYGARIYSNVKLGRDCRIAGFVASEVKIGDRVTMMGTIAHKYDRPLDWFRDELSAVIEDDVVVGLGAVVVGGINIGKGSYVAAGATLIKSVVENSVVLGINQILSLDEFEARKLQP